MHYYAKRTIQALFTVFAVMTLSFVLIRYLPGGPVDHLRTQLRQEQSGDIDQEQINNLVEAYTNVNPEEPLWQQYVEYMVSLLQADLGESMWLSQPVADVLFPALPWTVFYMSVATFLMFLIGVALGSVMAYWEGSRFDVGSTVISLLLNSTPNYIAALLLVYFLGYGFELFPTRGRVNYDIAAGFSPEYLGSVLHHGALPIISIVITGFGGVALSMRGNSIQVLGEDYMRVARLRGLSERRIALRYVARNAILPMYTGLMIAFGFVFGGSIIIEEIFAYPGVGYYMFQAIERGDYPVMMGAFLIITLGVVIAVFIADLTYGKIDPRAESGGEDSETY
ncbi:ABC transporter permease [Natronolimnobius sp. AArcel1]|uniref:ABC transporter permease n=1 Tax=Natronolimnobius sp. AArcel1 TaxID=1679093 RepID=UPI0013EB54D4|nr:ABC transporter permease [Natronolimnobius sp. AArcel1]NGM70563.1 ABC transporter permease [Natronolimnobius sp. AArcel1]